jgi:hypothetical protein
MLAGDKMAHFNNPAQPFRDIQKWLETGEGGGDWQDYEESAREAIAALKKLSEPQPRRDKGPREAYQNPDNHKLMVAVPSARSLIAALGRKEKAKALEASAAVLKHLEGIQ